MVKTKLGVSIGLLSAVVYFTALFGGYIPLFLLAGYILIVEQNDWLKRVCCKAVLLLIGFSVVSVCIDLLPNALGCISSFVAIFKGHFSYNAINCIVSVLDGILGIVKVVLFLMLGFKAYKIQDVKVSKIDHMIEE